MNERSLFLAALEIADSGERASYVRARCGDDTALCDRVMALLRSHAQADGFLDAGPAIRPWDIVESGAGDASPSAATAATNAQKDHGSRDVTAAHDSRVVPYDAESSSDACLGRTVRYFGDYELTAEIARGGMGIVYRARQVSLNRIVAIKMIRPDQLPGPREIERFRREAAAAAALDHPGIVPVFEVGQCDRQHYFSMAYVDGQSLAQRLNHGPLPPRLAAEIVRQVADAVEHAHERGVIHRDLKPANVLVDGEGRVRVTDFGVAKRIEIDRDLTMTGSIIGTPSYMAPEQAAGRADLIGPQSDVYAIGAILYCLTTTRPPFQASNTVDTLRQVLDCEPVPPRQLSTEIPRDLETICLKCLRKEPHRRYPSARELALDLGRWLDHRPIRARPVGSAERAMRWCRRHPSTAALSAVLALIVSVGCIGSWWGAVHYRDLANRERATAEAERESRAEAHKLRALAERRASSEANARHEAERLRSVAEAKTAESLERLVGQIASHGVQALNEGDPLASLPWFAEALRLDHSHPTRSPIHRMRLATTLAAAPGLLGVAAPGITDTSPAITSDGRVLVTAHEGVVTTFDTRTMIQTRYRVPVDRPANSFTLSPNGQRAAWVRQTAKARRGLPEFEIPTWDCIAARLAGPPIIIRGPVVQLEFDAAGNRLVVLDGSRTLHVFDPRTGEEAIPPIEPSGGATRFSFNAKRDTLVVESLKVQAGTPPEFRVQVYELETGHALSGPLVFPTACQHCELSADGSRLLIVTAHLPHAPGSAEVWDVPSGQRLIGPLVHGTGKGGGILRAALSPDGSAVATAGMDSVWLWNVKQGQQIGQPMKHGGPIAQVAFSPDGLQLATVGGSDALARVWDVARQTLVVPPLRHGLPIDRAAFSENGRALLTVTRSRESGTVEARVWDISMQGLRRDAVVTVPGERIWFDRDHRHLVAIEHDMRAETADTQENATHLQVYDGATGRAVSPSIAMPPHATPVDPVLSGDERVVIVGFLRTVRSGQFQSEVQGYDVASGRSVGPPVPLQGTIQHLVASHDGRHVVVLAHAASLQWVSAEQGYADTIILCDLNSARSLTRSAPGRLPILNAVFSRDQSRVVTIQRGLAQVWSTASGKTVGTPVRELLPAGTGGHLEGGAVAARTRAPCAVLLPDGQRVLATLGGTRIYTIDLPSGRDDGPEWDLGSLVALMRLSPDGKRLLSLTPSGTIRAWDVATRRPVGPAIVDRAADPARSSSVSDLDSIVDLSCCDDGRLLCVLKRQSAQLWDLATGMPVSPPIEMRQTLDRAWWDQERALALLSTASREIIRVPVHADTRPVGAMERLSQLFSGHRIDAVEGAVPVGAEVSAELWRSLRESEPELPETPREEISAWHRRRARDAEESGSDFAALFHLEPLVAETPKDAGLRLRRGDCLGRLGLWTRAKDDFETLLDVRAFDPAVQQAAAALRVRCGDDERYRQSCEALLSLTEIRPTRLQVLWYLRLATLQPRAVRAPSRLVSLAESAIAEATAEDPALLALRGMCKVRAGDTAGGSRDLQSSLLVYGRRLASTMPRAQVAAENLVGAGVVTPTGDDGTPRDWLFLGLAEAQLGHEDSARSWREKSARWLAVAHRDPTDPAIVGGTSDPQTRAMARMTSALLTDSGIRPRFWQTHLLPSWRELLELDILLEELDRTLLERFARLPNPVFAR